ncbi:P-II family nitrogen regulator [Flagellimonas pacifica]|uniref:Nitrogen regulatory protein P-II family n=1 Tax=Flagellimonas pacifica TaxID=1247520 RepID=A0A285N0Q2_9FLAO|nr:P-II family nitrogen regulator [Allomuricauda parva]SNZ01331.1 nitrogen regulatory protein P-II family [Allomuricauda parva]
MKEIKAFIRKEKLNAVAKALKEKHYCCFTVFEGEGVGDYTDPVKEFPTLKFPFLHTRIIKVEIVCSAEDVDKITDTIGKYARTGESGDGLIYVGHVDHCIKIKTGERNGAPSQKA